MLSIGGEGTGNAGRTTDRRLLAIPLPEIAFGLATTWPLTSDLQNCFRHLHLYMMDIRATFHWNPSSK